MTTSDSARRHPIGVVVNRTGLAANLIRAWERRYGVVDPERDARGGRLYSDADIERLRLLSRAVDGGRKIGQVVGLADDELAKLIADDASVVRAPSPSARSVPRVGDGDASDFVTRGLDAIRAFEPEELERVLQEASVGLGVHAVLAMVVTPLMSEVGRLWADDELRPAHEHLATVTARRFVESLPGRARRSGWAPTLLVATPAGQLHEIGAAVVAASAEADGWRVVSLGVDVPAEDLALAARASDARAISLSITHPLDDPRLPAELARLRSLVGPDLPILVGGRGLAAYLDAAEHVAARPLAGLAELRGELGRIRDRHPPLEEGP